MAASSGIAQPIKVWRVLGVGGAQPLMKRLLEKLTQTYLIGTPVQVEAATGFIIACAAITNVATAIIAGFSTEPGANLAASGTPKTLTYGSVQNQASASLIPLGAPINDAPTGINVAADTTEFQGVYGDSATAANAVLAQVQVGAIFGLTKDAGNNYWYVDNNITTAAGGACVEITALIDPVGTLNGRVAFKVTKAAQQLLK
jgi:hypothetical protein